MRIDVRQALALIVGFTLAASAGVHAKKLTDEHGYRTDGSRVPSDQNECAGVPSCFSATLPATSVPAKGRAEATFACPPSHPNLWNWDAAQHEYITVRLVDADVLTVTVEGINAASIPGDFVVSLGCSTEPYAGNGFNVSRHLAPTSRLQKRETVHRRGKGPGSVGNVGSDACDGVPDCQLQPQATFAMGGWASTTKSYACAAPYPYAWGFSYTQTGSPSVSAIGEIGAVSPGNMNILLTNWNPFATDDVSIVVACSKQNSFGGSCGGVQGDPGCPQVPGSGHEYCSKGPVPVCFGTYQERCQPSNQLYQCTDDVIVPWCQPCPG
jgi:hypothetical protein